MMKTLLIAVLSLLLGTAAFAQINPGDLVVNEIMQNPGAVSDGNGEYFEIYNTRNDTVSLLGWTIRDKDSDSHTISADVRIAPNGYLVLGTNADTSTNGGAPVAYEYSSFFLSNSADEVILVNTAGVTIDSVGYDGGPAFPDPNGKSMELRNPGVDNNIGSNWLEAVTPFGAGDLGTPGSQNSVFTAPSVGDIRLNEVDYAADRIELYNTGVGTIDVTNLIFCAQTVYPTPGSMTLVSGSLMLEPDSFVVLEQSGFLNDAGSDLGLYRAGTSGGGFTNPDSMIDFVQYGTTGNPREPVAVAKGIWGAGTAVPLVGAGNTVSYFGGGFGVSNWGEGINTLGAPNDPLNQPPVINSVDRAFFVPDANSVLPLSADITDDTFVDEVFVIWTVDGANLDSSEMFPGKESMNFETNSFVFFGDIPPSANQNGSLVEFYVRATDEDGAVVTSAVQGYFAGYTPLENIRVNDPNGVNVHNGYAVRAAGVATVTAGVFSSFDFNVFMQDSTAGVNLFVLGDDSTFVGQGDSVIAEGTINQFSGALEITTPDFSLTNLGCCFEPPAVPISAADLNSETFEGMLVRLNGILFDDDGNFSEGNYEFNDGAGEVRVDGDTDIPGKEVPGHNVDVIGIATQFDPSSPFNSGYQLLPRGSSDFGPLISNHFRDVVVPDAGGTVTVFADLEAFNLTESVPVEGWLVYSVNGGQVDSIFMDLFSGDQFNAMLVDSINVNDGDRIDYRIRAIDLGPEDDPSSCLRGQGYFVGTTDIDEVSESAPDGSPLYVGYGARTAGIVNFPSGIIENEADTNSVIYIFQDATGGIGALDTVTSSYAVGDSVVVEGSISTILKNALMGEPGYNATVVSQGNALDTIFTDVAGINSGLFDLLLTAVDTLSEVNTDWPLPGEEGEITALDQNLDTLQIILFAASDFGGTPEPVYPIRAVGIAANGADVGEPDLFALLPRFRTDIIDLMVVSIEDNPGLPKAFALRQNYPNPFNPETTIEYDLPKSAQVNLSVYNILGQKVRTLVNSDQPAGKKTVKWDGRNDFGRAVSTGVYFFKIEAGGFVKTRKMLFLK